MNEDVLYYRSCAGNGSRITTELMGLICSGIKEYMDSDKFRNFVSESRIPNERELYSVFVKSIIESCEPRYLGHIASEFQVGLEDDAKGRADLLFNYRSVGFLLEIKSGTLSARKLGFPELNNEPRQAVREKWVSAVEQLKKLDITSVERVMKNRIVKIPFAIYFHYGAENRLTETDYEHIHKTAEDFISNNDDENYIPDFSFFSRITPTVKTRTRRLSLQENPNTHLFGFSIFGKQLNNESN